MTTNPPADVAKLRELLEKATPGPWTFAPGIKVSYFHRNIYAHGKPLAHVLSTKNAGVAGNADANAALIVESVNALPALLDHLAAQASQIEALAKERDELRVDVRIWKGEAETRSEGLVELNLDRADLSVRAMIAAEAATAAEAKAAKMREALKPFISEFGARRDAYIRRYPQNPGVGARNFDAMPDEWKMEGSKFSMGDFRRARAAFDQEGAS